MQEDISGDKYYKNFYDKTSIGKCDIIIQNEFGSMMMFRITTRPKL